MNSQLLAAGKGPIKSPAYLSIPAPSLENEVSMLSNVNLAYVHLRLDDIFGRDKWFGGVNVLFVGDILQLPPVNGAPVLNNQQSSDFKAGVHDLCKHLAGQSSLTS